MNKYVYRVVCEWDIGLTDRTWDSEEKAFRVAEEAWESLGMEEAFSEVVEDNYLWVESSLVE